MTALIAVAKLKISSLKLIGEMFSDRSVVVFLFEKVSWNKIIFNQKNNLNP